MAFETKFRKTWRIRRLSPNEKGKLSSISVMRETGFPWIRPLATETLHPALVERLLDEELHHAGLDFHDVHTLIRLGDACRRGLIGASSAHRLPGRSHRDKRVKFKMALSGVRNS
jgi:hypothetical protein